jgi:large repetitive protein
VIGGAGASSVPDEGAIGGGVRLAERSFGADRDADGRWVTIADIAVGDGEAVEGRRIFRLEVQGIAGGAGNVFDVAVSVRANANEAPPDLRVSAVHPSFRIPTRGQALGLQFTLPPDASEITVGNFDLAGGRIELVGPFRTIPLTSSQQGSWQRDRTDVLEHERGEPAEIVVADGEEIPNDLTVSITDAAARQIPVELPIRLIQSPVRPVARADVKTLSCEMASFDASASTGQAGHRLAFRWVFADDATSRDGRQVEHRYERPGAYDVRLEVRDTSTAVGNGSAINLKVDVLPPPTARIAVRERAGVGEPITFDAGPSTAAPGSTVATFEWSLNGAYVGEGERLDHVFAAPGDYEIGLRVTDASNRPCNNAVATARVHINAPPVAHAGQDRLVAPGEVVRFDATASTDADGRIVRYGWDFGDGTTADGPVVGHRFAGPGTYRVTLRVEDDAGVANSAASDALTVRVNAPPTADAGGDRTVIINRPVQFTASASRDPDGSIIAHRWDFGGGIVKSGRNVVDAFSATGSFPVTLTVTDDSGVANSTQATTITVRVVNAPNQPPQANAGTDRSVAVGEQVAFDGSASTDPDGTIISYQWDFGDGTQADGARRTHTYWRPGRYTAKLTVRDDSGLDNDTSTTTAEIIVTPVANAPPVAAAGGNAGLQLRASGGAPLVIKTYGTGHGSNSVPESGGRRGRNRDTWARTANHG